MEEFLQVNSPDQLFLIVNVKAEIMGWHHLVKVGQFYPLRVCPSLGQKPLHNGGKCPTVS